MNHLPDASPFAAADKVVLGMVVTMVWRAIGDAIPLAENAESMALSMTVVNLKLMAMIKLAFKKSCKHKKAKSSIFKARIAKKCKATASKLGARKSKGGKAAAKKCHRLECLFTYRLDLWIVGP